MTLEDSFFLKKKKFKDFEASKEGRRKEALFGATMSFKPGYFRLSKGRDLFGPCWQAFLHMSNRAGLGMGYLYSPVLKLKRFFS